MSDMSTAAGVRSCSIVTADASAPADDTGSSHTSVRFTAPYNKPGTRTVTGCMALDTLTEPWDRGTPPPAAWPRCMSLRVCRRQHSQIMHARDT